MEEGVEVYVSLFGVLLAKGCTLRFFFLGCSGLPVQAPCAVSTGTVLDIEFSDSAPCAEPVQVPGVLT